MWIDSANRRRAPLRVFLLASLSFYLLAIGLGVALRVFFIRPFGWLEFGNAIHAHSHTLYFGWVGLGLLTLAFQRIDASDKVVKGVLVALAGISLATFLTFLHSGYALPGMVVSSLSLVVWGGAVVVFFRRARGRRGIEVAFLRVALIYAAIACVAACVRVGILIAGVQSPLPGKLAVFAFLHDFAWFFVFGVFGLLVGHARERWGVVLDEGLLRWQLWLSAPLAWLTFPLGVAGGDQGALGWVARVAALGLLAPAALACVNLFRGSRQAAGPLRIALLALVAFYGAQAAMEGLGAVGLASLAIQSRHLAMLYLHVLLLGFVTLGLMMVLLTSLGASMARGLLLHVGGMGVMSVGLCLAGLPALWAIPDFLPRLGHWLALGGGILTMAAGGVWLLAAAATGWRQGAPRVEAAGRALPADTPPSLALRMDDALCLEPVEGEESQAFPASRLRARWWFQGGDHGLAAPLSLDAVAGTSGGLLQRPGGAAAASGGGPPRADHQAASRSRWRGSCLVGFRQGGAGREPHDGAGLSQRGRAAVDPAPSRDRRPVPGGERWPGRAPSRR